MSEEQTNIKIVQTVEKFPVIYDYLSPGHSNKEEIDKAWHAVSKEVNVDVNSCKEKWRNCRNCWARYLRQTPPVSGSAARPKKPYYLAEYLAFLTPFTKSRRQLGSMEIPPTTEKLSPTIEEDPVSPTTTEVRNVSDHEEMQSLPPPREIRKKRERSKMDIDEVFTSYPKTKAKRIPGERSDNPDLCFFKSLLPDVAKLTPAQKSAFKLFVQQNLHDTLYN
ncbi:uncharacterized protein LOC110831102 [Zootermopsis nevadensis]|uniref:uncharacterized protein LOC110831102 n=1 Tax=Zootermopsis nevadensis TaxID=136037 RepID=UPI000B8EE57B|nr:uncharacterized protein LOC110831102 [Zootermopsis nevadensis]